MDIVPAPSPPGNPVLVTVQQVVETYLAYIDANLNEHHLEEVRRVLATFAKDLGSRRLEACRPLDLLAWLRSNQQWASAWTIKRINNTVQRAFNWCWRMGVIDRNPFRAVTWETGESRRAMKEEEFKALLRNSGPPFRRLLLALRWTGMRPSELRTLRWCDVDIERGLIVLTKHKTRKKTKRPRLIPLIPQLLRLLKWLQERRGVRRSWHGKPLSYGPVADALREVLADGDLPIREVTDRLQALGVDASYRSLWKARKAAHVQIIPARIPGKGRCMLYHLLDGGNSNSKAEVRDSDTSLVFVNEHGVMYTRRCLCAKVERLREKLCLPADCCIYGIRHLFATSAILRGVSLKMVSTLLGHADSRMAELHYIHVAEMVEPLQEAMQQAVGIQARPRQPARRTLKGIVEAETRPTEKGGTP